MSKYLVSFAILLTSAATAVPAVASSTGGHCPPENGGVVLWQVGRTVPYAADHLTDEYGNGNGFVCAQPKKLVIDDTRVALGGFTPLAMPYCYMGRPLPPDTIPPPCRR